MRCAGLLMVLSLMVCGCQQQRVAPPSVKNALEGGPLSFLQDGKVTQEQVLMQLGIPTAEFEQQRILAYRLHYDEKKGMKILPRETNYGSEPQWMGVSCSLILVFDSAHVLAKHHIVLMGD